MTQGSTSYKHSSRTYYDVYNALVTAYKNKPTWLFKEMSGQFEYQSELLNRVAQDILYPTTRESAYSFADKCDYAPVEADGSTVTVTVTLTGAMAKTLAAGYQLGGISTSTGKMVIFELTASASSGGGASISASCKQKKTETSVLVGSVTSADEWQEYPIDGYTKIIKSTISLVLGVDTWTRVDNFDNSISTDKHFCLIYQSAGKSRILFGDGTNGKIPTLNDSIYATFSTTQGTQGQMAIGEINLNIGNDADILSLTNAAATSGGNDAETIASIIVNARANVRLRSMVWSEEDVETAAKASSSSVVKAKCIPGIGTCVVYVVPSGGGAPSAGLKTTVQTYIQALTQFGKMPVTASDPVYSTQNVAASITVRAGFVSATVQDLTEFAMTLIVSEVDNQVIESYDENGIDVCRTDVINSVWAWAFTSAENDALEFIINQWKALLGSREYREWGQDLEVGNLWIMGDALYDYGVDVFSLTSPASNVSINDTTMCAEGTVTVTVV